MDMESVETDTEDYLNKENEYLPRNEEKTVSFWSVSDTRLLLHLFQQKEDDLNRYGRQEQFWEMIAKEINTINPILGKTAIQCSNKLTSLKHTYKKIKDYNKKSGNNRKTWTFYEDMDEIFGNRAWATPKYLAEVGSSELSSSSNELSDSSSSLTSSEPKRKRKSPLQDLINQMKKEKNEIRKNLKCLNNLEKKDIRCTRKK